MVHVVTTEKLCGHGVQLYSKYDRGRKHHKEGIVDDICDTCENQCLFERVSETQCCIGLIHVAFKIYKWPKSMWILLLWVGVSIFSSDKKKTTNPKNKTTQWLSSRHSQKN